MLRSVTAKNFKSFGESTFDLSPLTLILGPNGAGKSNFFDGLRFLKFMGDGTTIRDAIQGHATPVPTGVTIPGIRGGQQETVYFAADDPVFRLETTMVSGSTTYHYAISVDVQRFRVMDEELRSSDVNPGSYIYSTSPETSPLIQDPNAPSIAARFYKKARGANPRRHFNPGVSILSQFAGREAESRANEQAAAAVRRELQTITPLELRPEVLRDYAPMGSSTLGEHGENFPAVVANLESEAEFRMIFEEGSPERVEADRAAASLQTIRSWLAELTPRPIVEITTEAAPTGERIFGVREEPEGPIVSARSLSDGTLRFAALAFAVLGSPRRTTLVIEELENGINPSRVELVLQMLRSVTVGRDEVQVLASTHSPTLLNMAEREVVDSALLVGWNHEAACSNVVRVGDLPGLDDVLARASAGELQTEGWFELAATA